MDGQGRLILTESGRIQAGELLKDYWLEQISAYELIMAFAQALSLLSWRADAWEEGYLEFLHIWAVKFDDQCPAHD